MVMASLIITDVVIIIFFEIEVISFVTCNEVELRPGGGGVYSLIWAI